NGPFEKLDSPLVFILFLGSQSQVIECLWGASFVGKALFQIGASIRIVLLFKQSIAKHHLTLGILWLKLEGVTESLLGLKHIGLVEPYDAQGDVISGLIGPELDGLLERRLGLVDDADLQRYSGKFIKKIRRVAGECPGTSEIHGDGFGIPSQLGDLS